MPIAVRGAPPALPAGVAEPLAAAPPPLGMPADSEPAPPVLMLMLERGGGSGPYLVEELAPPPPLLVGGAVCCGSNIALWSCCCCCWVARTGAECPEVNARDPCACVGTGWGVAALGGGRHYGHAPSRTVHSNWKR